MEFANISEVDGSLINPKILQVVHDKGCVSEDADIADPNLDIKPDKESGDIDSVESEVWTDDESIRVGELNLSDDRAHAYDRQ